MENNEDKNSETASSPEKDTSSDNGGVIEDTIAEQPGGQSENNAARSVNGTRVIPADELEKVPTTTSIGQKALIAIGILILIVIGLSFQGAEERENRAAEENFSHPVERIVRDISAQAGVSIRAGQPQWRLSAQTKGALVELNFPNGGLTQLEASAVGRGVCAALAREYVKRGYAPRHIRVIVYGGGIAYGDASYNGDIDVLGWEPATD